MGTGYCAPYSGKICKPYINSAAAVWFNNVDGGWENEKITIALWNELISELPDFCKNAAEVSQLQLGSNTGH
jgi:muscle, skeletal, receptor tyrosine kinase